MEFIALNKQLKRLYTAKPSLNRQSIFTAELTANKIEICQYSLKGDRKSFCLSDTSNFFTADTIDDIQLLTDQYDSSVLHGAAKCNGDACLFLIDMHKLKIAAIGFVPVFEDVKSNSYETLSLWICGKGYLRSYKCGEGVWEMEEVGIKKLPYNANLISLEFLEAGIVAVATVSSVFLAQGSEIMSTLSEFPAELLGIRKFAKGLLVQLCDGGIRYYIN